MSRQAAIGLAVIVFVPALAAAVASVVSIARLVPDPLPLAGAILVAVLAGNVGAEWLGFHRFMARWAAGVAASLYSAFAAGVCFEVAATVARYL